MRGDAKRCSTQTPRRLDDRFAEAAGRCCDLVELRMLVTNVAVELGFDYFALLDHASLGKRDGCLVRIDNYPASWTREMVARDYAARDPVHLACHRTNIGFRWRDISRLITLDACHKTILARSRCFGLGSGFTVPANVPGEPSASCSFAVRTGGKLPLERLPSAELVGAHALRAARRLRPWPGRASPPRLSPRELECLRLVALGKTDWEIARIIGVHAETARQYVKRARAAYAVVSRTQLVVRGLADHLIDFGDAIPPDGGIG